MAQEEGRRARKRYKNAPSYDEVKKKIDAKENAAAERKAARSAAKKPLTPAERYEQEKAARAKKGSSGYGYSQHLMGGSGSSSSFNPRSIREEILSYLLDEGFASDEKSAEAIMSAMSEAWIESIVEASPTTKTSSGQTVTVDKQYPATLSGQKGMKSYGPSGTEYFTPNIRGTNITDLGKAKFKSVASGQYEPIPKDQGPTLTPRVNDATKYDPRYKPPSMRGPGYKTPTTSINPKPDN